GHFLTSVTGAVGNLGTLSLAANGKIGRASCRARVQIPAGSNANGGNSTHVDTFTVTAADGTTKDVSFTIHGTNDAAVIGTPTVADVTEDTPSNATVMRTVAGSISHSDVHPGEGHFLTSVTGAVGNLGTLSLAANGSYTYSVVNADVQSLTGSLFPCATLFRSDTFTVTAADGTTKD